MHLYLISRGSCTKNQSTYVFNYLTIEIFDYLSVWVFLDFMR